MRRLLIALGTAAFLTAAPAGADEAAFAGARATIEGQLEAFVAGDFDAAYAYAAPSIKRLFPTRDQFMNMVRNGYPQVYRPRAYDFGKVEMTGDGRLIQQVLIQGPDGRDYEAVYMLELQPDGVWRITGVSLRGAATLST